MIQNNGWTTGRRYRSRGGITDLEGRKAGGIGVPGAMVLLPTWPRRGIITPGVTLWGLNATWSNISDEGNNTGAWIPERTSKDGRCFCPWTVTFSFCPPAAAPNASQMLEVWRQEEGKQWNLPPPLLSLHSLWDSTQNKGSKRRLLLQIIYHTTFYNG